LLRFVPLNSVARPLRPFKSFKCSSACPEYVEGFKRSPAKSLE
jgi:hypothetical protein